MRKKGDISINVIIIAIISLMVLVVLLMIFSGKMGIFSNETEEIVDKECKDIDGYRYIAEGTSCGEGYVTAIAGYQDVSPGYKCCIPDQTSLN